MMPDKPVHPDLLAAQDLVYAPNGFACSAPQREAESAEYGAYAFSLDGLAVRFRVAKITPEKIGQFVTLWKRIGEGPIQPYDMSDDVDFFVVSVRGCDNFGHFVFAKSTLAKQGIFSKAGKGGKRAIRVYPPWDETINAQARKTQRWQMDHFLRIPHGNPVDHARVRELYNRK